MRYIYVIYIKLRIHNMFMIFLYSYKRLINAYTVGKCIWTMETNFILMNKIQNCCSSDGDKNLDFLCLKIVVLNCAESAYTAYGIASHRTMLRNSHIMIHLYVVYADQFVRKSVRKSEIITLIPLLVRSLPVITTDKNSVARANHIRFFA